jgi:hypothetical protein
MARAEWRQAETLAAGPAARMIIASRGRAPPDVADADRRAAAGVQRWREGQRSTRSIISDSGH